MGASLSSAWGEPETPSFSLREKATVRLWLKKSSKLPGHPLREPKPRGYVVEHYRNLIKKGDYPPEEKLRDLADFLLKRGWVTRESFSERQLSVGPIALGVFPDI